MRQEIQERMDRMITFSTTQNTIFDLIVNVVDEAIAPTTYNGYSEFNVIDGGLRYAIQTNENYAEGIGTIFIYIDNADTGIRYANLTVNLDGTTSEDYYTMPRAKRNAIFALFGDIMDAVDSYINNETTNE